MVFTVLDLVTMGTCFSLTVAILLAIYILVRRQVLGFSYAYSKVPLQLFIVFLLALFVNSIYMSIPYTHRVGMLPPISREIPPPEVFINYPSIARVGETVEIVLEAMNTTIPVNIDINLQDRETGEIIDTASIALEPRSIEKHNFRKRMPEDELAVVFVVRHPEPVADTSMELRTTITVNQSGMEVAALLIMGVLISFSALAIVIAWKKR